MTEQPTTPPPAGRTPTLGRGWSAHPDVGGVPPAEPYQPPARQLPPGGWPRTGTAGASTQLTDDEHPVTVPARPYIGYQEHGVSRFTPPAPRRTWFARAIGWFRR